MYLCLACIWIAKTIENHIVKNWRKEKWVGRIENWEAAAEATIRRINDNYKGEKEGW